MDPIAAAREHFIETDFASKPESPSYGAHRLHPPSFREMQWVESTHIPCDRSHDLEEIIPLTLLHQVFGQFIDHCQIGTMTEDDNCRICTTMK